MMLSQHQLEQFLRQGAFDSIAIGASEKEVLTLLGPPNEEGVGGQSIRILSYANRFLQISIHRGSVVHIGMYWRVSTAPSVQLGGVVVPLLTTDAFERWLKASAIEWKREIAGAKSAGHYRLGANTHVIFEDGVLYSIQAS